ncbi:hypothetical protein JOF53_001255 [Crossiella equi]|uniref:Superoxide dismutase n=1 Tax=Crossiella equi TaxID=130796 RepID=A0ABS5A716_9PSEU|nr:SMP-30/gluconolactonase/LRE family protein [Crossiella equi]MBP2472383.1 hypothetical protein [Crossiella equi]
MRRLLIPVLAALLALTPGTAAATPPPDVLPLPNGFSPEGITVHGRNAYTGSLVDGTIRRLDLLTGASTRFAPPPGPRKISVGLDVDHLGRLWVAGGGDSPSFPGVLAGFRVYDTRTGALLADVPTPFARLVNDVKATRDAVWFTDSLDPAALIRVPLARDGRIGTPHKVVLGGDWAPGGGGIEANGIAATPDGTRLLVAQTIAPGGGAALYLVPAGTSGTAEAHRIALQAPLPSADGLVLLGRTLHVVTFNGVVRVELSPGLTSGRVLGTTPVPGAAFPTTADVFGPRMYVVDGNITQIGNPAAEFKVVAIRTP